MNHRTLVLDGNQRAALAAVRSLGSKGLWVAVGETSISSLAASSRYCAHHIGYPDPVLGPRSFFNSLLDQIKQLDITFLLPITESTTYVLLKYRSELPDSVILPFPDTDIVEKLANKNALFGAAPHQGVPTPETRECNNLNDGLRALESIDKFPIVLKPYKSKILLEHKIISTQVMVVWSKEEAVNALKSHSFFEHPFTLQAFIKGHGRGVFALFNHGVPVCYFAHRRLREKPPGGGVSVLSESSDIDGALKRSAEKLLQNAGWHGVAMVEFRVTEDGTGYLIEINPRFWGSLQLAIDSGADFPWLLYKISTGKDVTQVRLQSSRLRWLLGDLDRLYLVLKAPFSAYSLREKLLEALRFFKPVFGTRHEVNRWGDLRPAWFELKQYIRALRK